MAFELSYDPDMIDPESENGFFVNSLTRMPNKKVGVDYYPLLALLHFLLILYLFFFYPVMIPDGGSDALASIKHSQFAGGNKN